MYMMLLKNGVKFFADATVNIDPDAETLADIADPGGRRRARLRDHAAHRDDLVLQLRLGAAPGVAEDGRGGRASCARLRPDLEIDGEVQADIAVEPEKMRELFPFSRLTDEANVLIFPSLAAGNAAYKVLAALGGATAIGPILLGVNKPVTVLPRDANVDTIVSMTAYTVARSQS